MCGQENREGLPVKPWTIHSIQPFRGLSSGCCSSAPCEPKLELLALEFVKDLWSKMGATACFYFQYPGGLCCAAAHWICTLGGAAVAGMENEPLWEYHSSRVPTPGIFPYPSFSFFTVTSQSVLGVCPCFSRFIRASLPFFK